LATLSVYSHHLYKTHGPPPPPAPAPPSPSVRSRMLPLGSRVGKGSNDPYLPANPLVRRLSRLAAITSTLVLTSDENFTLDDVAYASMARSADPGRLSIFKARPAIA